MAKWKSRTKRIVCLLAGLALAAVAFWIVLFTVPSTTLTEMSKGGQWSFLLYAHLSNRILIVDHGAVRSVDTGMGNHYLGHYAYPAVSPDGGVVAFVRGLSGSHAEEIVLFDATHGRTSGLLEWPAAVSSIAWSPKGQQLAFVADKKTGSYPGTSLFLVDILSRKVEDLTPEARWVWVTSRPSWSPQGERIAFETRLETPDGETQKIMIVDLITKSPIEVADGWFPSWVPEGNKLAYITSNGTRCYEVDLRTNQRRLMWWSLRTIGGGLAGPPVWNPSGGGAMFAVGAGIDGDSRDTYYLDFASGRSRRVTHDHAFEVVGWWKSGGQSTTEPKQNR
jgi:Tol biopolymer transport system component